MNFNFNGSVLEEESKTNNESEEQKVMNPFKAEFEERWHAIDKKRQETFSRRRSTAQATGDFPRFTFEKVNLRKLIHPIDHSFSEFASSKLAELESMKSNIKGSESNRPRTPKMQENKNQKTFLKEEDRNFNYDRITLEEAIEIEQNQQSGKQKLKSILKLINDDGAYDKDDYNKDLPKSDYNEPTSSHVTTRTFLKEDEDTKVPAKKKKEKAANKIINITFGNTDKENNFFFVNNVDEEKGDNKILRKIRILRL